MGLTVIDPGPLTTVQDLGRTGYLDAGFSPSGALDGFSARLANFLAGNPPGEAVLEMTLAGVSAIFDSPAVIALAGADMGPLLNGRPAAMNRALAVREGDILSLSLARRGMRTYLAAAGGFAVESVLGSRSTSLKVRLGGFKGRKLQSRDTLPFRRVVQTLPNMERRIFEPARNAAPDILGGTVAGPYTEAAPLVLRVIEGKEAALFTPEGIETFYNSVYTVGNESDRMGVRLEGPPAASRNGTDSVSNGIACGAVQIPGSGKPIVLLNDRQTVGGYAKPGVVITGDLWRLAQTPPGQAIRFSRIDPRRAERIYRETERAMARLQRQISEGKP
jgi:biotin-dependent carboxylase-like uncharacterized protein